MLGFNNADETTSKLAYTAGNKTQAEQLAKTGVSLAMLKLYTYTPASSYSHFSTQSASSMGGSVDYNASIEAGLASDERQVVATGTIGSGDNEVQVTMTAIVHYNSGRWEIDRSFIE